MCTAIKKVYYDVAFCIFLLFILLRSGDNTGSRDYDHRARFVRRAICVKAMSLKTLREVVFGIIVKHPFLHNNIDIDLNCDTPLQLFSSVVSTYSQCVRP